jgi:tetratricopeptide (TPR) repeat protein
MKPTASRPGGHPRIAEFTGPLSIPGGEVAGAEIVRELGAEVSLAVWQTLRGVLMWAAETPDARPALFDGEAMRAWECELLVASWEPELRYPLAVLVGELAGDPTPEPIARACLCVTDWALTREAWSTGLAFAEAAALAWPEHPRYAWMVGRLLRTRGRLREAEQWIQRCVRVAIATGDWEAQVLGLSTLGNVRYKAGKYREARHAHSEALRCARRHGLRDLEGEVLHDLTGLNSATGDLAEAERCARAAFDIYREGHPRLPALAHDVAQLWMMRGQFARALPVLQQLLPYFSDASERLTVLASAARAAAGCEEHQVFSDLFREAKELMRTIEITNAPALVDLAVGASSVCFWGEAEAMATRAIDVATASDQSDTRLRAEAALKCIQQRRSAEEVYVTRERGSDALLSKVLTSLASAETHAGYTASV